MTLIEIIERNMNTVKYGVIDIDSESFLKYLEEQGIKAEAEMKYGYEKLGDLNSFLLLFCNNPEIEKAEAFIYLLDKNENSLTEDFPFVSNLKLNEEISINQNWHNYLEVINNKEWDKLFF